MLGSLLDATSKSRATLFGAITAHRSDAHIVLFCGRGSALTRAMRYCRRLSCFASPKSTVRTCSARVISGFRQTSSPHKSRVTGYRHTRFLTHAEFRHGLCSLSWHFGGLAALPHRGVDCAVSDFAAREASLSRRRASFVGGKAQAGHHASRQVFSPHHTRTYMDNERRGAHGFHFSAVRDEGPKNSERQAEARHSACSSVCRPDSSARPHISFGHAKSLRSFGARHHRPNRQNGANA